MQQEIVYLNHANTIDLILKRKRASDPAPIPLTNGEMDAITRMTLSFGSLLIDSDNGDSDPIRWRKSEYATGEIRLFLGAEAITAKIYSAPLVVYDPTNPEGVMWGRINIKVEEDPEAAEAES